MAETAKKDPTIWPRARQVADQLINDIQTGVFLPGEQLPSARELCVHEHYGHMAIYTATGVSKLVQEAGLVTTRKGVRARVKPYEQWPRGSYDPARIMPRPESVQADTPEPSPGDVVPAVGA